MPDTWNWTPDETGMEDRGSTPPPLSPEGYAATGGTACPACAGTDIARSDDLDIRRQVVTRGLICEHCGATWTAVYELTGYEGLCAPRKEATPCLTPPG